ncbi:MAG: helix-turn-helix domain-containing protein [Myxococcales bacterium]|nr:helix-turn-helix domain-containing protein [Myxococcales bacterium]
MMEASKTATGGRSLDEAGRKETALLLLAEGASPAEVTAATGVHRATLWRWRNEDVDFSSRLAELRAQHLEAHRADLSAAVGRALARIVALVDDPLAPPAVQLRAAECILDRAGIGASSASEVPIVPLDADGERELVRSILDDPRTAALVAAEQVARARVASSAP